MALYRHRCVVPATVQVRLQSTFYPFLCNLWVFNGITSVAECFASLIWTPGVYRFRTDYSKPFGMWVSCSYVHSSDTLLLGLAVRTKFKKHHTVEHNASFFTEQNQGQWTILLRRSLYYYYYLLSINMNKKYSVQDKERAATTI